MTHLLLLAFRACFPRLYALENSLRWKQTATRTRQGRADPFLARVDMPRIALLTVGSTEFTQLVNAALTTEVLEALEHQGYTRFVVQHGKSRLSREALDAVAAAGERHECGEGALQVELHGYMNDIETRMRDAELVISHAGQSSVDSRASCCSGVWMDESGKAEAP